MDNKKNSKVTASLRFAQDAWANGISILLYHRAIDRQVASPALAAGGVPLLGPRLVQFSWPLAPPAA